ncbi:MAG: hypothetical protein JWO71_539 [Candidatus Acidoferrum typicum]|nr:hypothetical protein [Candidatus Acidoferrum typicum]
MVRDSSALLALGVHFDYSAWYSNQGTKALLDGCRFPCTSLSMKPVPHARMPDWKERHAKFVGLREDKNPREVVEEAWS